MPNLWSIILSLASQSKMTIGRAELDVEHDPEEDTDTLVMRIHCQATPAQTLAFWDSLSVRLDDWFTRLPERDVMVIINDIGLRFHWMENT